MGGISEDKDGDVADKDGDVADKDGDVVDKDVDLVDKDGEADTDIETEHWVFEPQAHLGQNALTPPYPVVPNSKVVIILTTYNLENSKVGESVLGSVT